ncbi:MAG: hypothetical protein LCI03_14150 [Actinobacteria bacterium]|nr:hypothetical protein [Actinomycetota bacterium]
MGEIERGAQRRFPRTRDAGTVLRRPDGMRAARRAFAVLLAFVPAAAFGCWYWGWWGLLAFPFVLLLVFTVGRSARGQVVLYDDRLITTGIRSRVVVRDDVDYIQRWYSRPEGRASYFVSLVLRRPRRFLHVRSLALPGLQVDGSLSQRRENEAVEWQDAAVAAIAER